jgi:hypothetical protein
MLKIILIVALAIALVVLFPFAVIFSLNTLFPVLAIPSNFDTWCAVIILGMFFRGEGISFSFKK